MKEVRYTGDFNEDVCNIKEPVIFKEKIKKFILRHFCFFKSLVWLGFLVVILVDIKNIVLKELILASIFNLVGMSGLGIVIYNGFNQIRTIPQSEKALLNLRKKLLKNFGVRISKKSLKESSVVKQEEICSTVHDKKDKVLNEEKVIRYFELLDREDQILVLKYVKSSLIDKDKDKEISRSYQLFLLEDEDYELENLPVTKKLKR